MIIWKPMCYNLESTSTQMVHKCRKERLRLAKEGSLRFGVKSKEGWGSRDKKN